MGKGVSLALLSWYPVGSCLLQQSVEPARGRVEQGCLDVKSFCNLDALLKRWLTTRWACGEGKWEGREGGQEPVGSSPSLLQEGTVSPSGLSWEVWDGSLLSQTPSTATSCWLQLVCDPPPRGLLPSSCPQGFALVHPGHFSAAGWGVMEAPASEGTHLQAPRARPCRSPGRELPRRVTSKPAT